MSYEAWYSPHEKEEDEPIKTEEELSEAKIEAGVIGDDVMIEKLIRSGETNLVEEGLKRMRKIMNDQRIDIKILKQDLRWAKDELERAGKDTHLIKSI